MISGMLGRINTAEQMTVEQLQAAIDRGSLPAYIGVPILQEKMQMRDRALAIPYGQQVAQQPPIIDEIMARAQATPNAAQMVEGIDQLPTQLRPDAGYARGGIVALAEGGLTANERRRLAQEKALRDRYRAESKDTPSNWSKFVDLLGLQDEEVGRAMREGTAQGSQSSTGVDVAPSGQPFEPTPKGRYYNPAVRELMEAGQGQGNLGLPPADTPTLKQLQGIRGIKQDTSAEEEKPRVDTPPPGATTGGTGSAGIAAAQVGLPQSAVGARPTTEGIASTGMSPAMQEYIDLLRQESFDAKGGKEADRNMALLQAGLSMMAGQSPHALENIGRGALAGVEHYQGSRADADQRSREALREAMSGQMALEGMEQKERHFAASQELEREKIAAMLQRASASASKATGGQMTQAQITTLFNKNLTAVAGEGMPLPDVGSKEYEELANRAWAMTRQQIYSAGLVRMGAALPDMGGPSEEAPTIDGSSWNF